MQELTEMLGFRPYQFYYYTWKYVSPICMAVLMTASIIQLGVSPPGYSAWIREEVSAATSPSPPGAAQSRRLLCSSQLRSFLLPLLLGDIPTLLMPWEQSGLFMLPRCLQPALPMG